MALTAVTVEAPMIGDSGGVRLDPRFHVRRALVSPFFLALAHAAPLGTMVAGARNGLNLPRVAYADVDAAGEGLYASVSALSSFVLREKACAGLLTDEGGGIVGTSLSIEDVKASENELLVTRSGTPGIAWPASMTPEGVKLVPSGFLIRVSMARNYSAAYTAAVLNHPAWRLLTSGLAAGKRQDNLSQHQLLAVPIPVLPEPASRRIAENYTDALVDIQDLLADDSAFAGVCDRVLAATVGLTFDPLPRTALRQRIIPLSEVAATPSLRLDNRWHGPANVRVLQLLTENAHRSFGSLLTEPPAKGPQPTWVSDEDVEEDTPRAVATVSIQDGRVVADLTKATTSASVATFAVSQGDLLIAMDGDGSLGKTAVMRTASQGTVDSHVARCRVQGGIDVALALSCFMNSSWGRVQTEGRMTGATGQTQLGAADLSAVLVPDALLQRATAVARAYEETLTEYEPAPARSRRLLCETSAHLTDELVRSGGIAGQGLEDFRSPVKLYAKLQQLYPSVRQL